MILVGYSVDDNKAINMIKKVKKIEPTAYSIKKIELKNWKTFSSEVVEMPNRVFIVGPNASGKSNFLDAILFLKAVAMEGFQLAIKERKGISSIRSLAAKSDPNVSIGIVIESADGKILWDYRLTFGRPSKGARGPSEIPIVKEELLTRTSAGTAINVISRTQDELDESGQQTRLESAFHQGKFLDFKNFLKSISFMHLVPQMVRERRIEEIESPDLDKYGRNFIELIGQAPKRTRERHLKQIAQMISCAVPNLVNLELAKDEYSGAFHLQARFKNWRTSDAKKGARHEEALLSDGTIRLVGIFWILLEVADRGGVLLIDEPELSLHPGIIKQLPFLFWKIQNRHAIQIIITTHSYDLLRGDGVSPREVLLLLPEVESTKIYPLNKLKDAKDLLDSNFNINEVVETLTTPKNLSQLSLGV